MLIKKGLDKYLNHGAVSGVTDKDCVFSATIASISPIKDVLSEEDMDLLYSFSAIFNSKLFTYVLLMTSSSFGAGRNRANFKEFFEMLFVSDDELINLSKKIHLEKKENLDFDDSSVKKLEEKLYNLFQLSQIEKELISYALEVSIPVMKRLDRHDLELPEIFKPIQPRNKDILISYCKVYVNHFGKRFSETESYFNIDAYISADFIAVHFRVSKKRTEQIKIDYNSDLNTTISKIGGLGIEEVSTNLFVQQDIRGFNKNSFYVIKPNISKNWHLALAHSDLTEFIEAIAKSEIKKVKQ